jgi:integrase
MAGHTRGTGSYYRRGKTYWISYWVAGRQIKESTKSSDEAEAKRLLKVRIGEAAAGKNLSPERATVEDLCALVLSDYRLRKLRDLINVESRIERHLKPTLGKIPASRFTPHQVREYIDIRRQESASDATINRELAILRRGFTLAQREDPPLVRSAPYIPKLEEDNVRQGFIERPQYEILLAMLPEHLKCLLVVGYHVGCRLGELRKLRWEQVDLDALEIRIEKRQAKTKRPRTIPIYGDMVEWLRRQRGGRAPGPTLPRSTPLCRTQYGTSRVTACGGNEHFGAPHGERLQALRHRCGFRHPVRRRKARCISSAGKAEAPAGEVNRYINRSRHV